MAERSSVSPYFRVDADILDDPALIDLTFDHGPLVLSTWISLLALAKKQRGLGRVTTSIRAVCRMIGDRPNGSFAQRIALWEGMIERGLMTLESGSLDDGEVVVSISKWHDKQSLTSAERQKLYRQRAKAGEPAPAPPPGDKVYVVSDGAGGIKVGYTSAPLKRRIANLQTGITTTLTLVAAWPGTRVEERELHAALAEHHVRGEWFEDCEETQNIITRYANGNGVGVVGNGVTTQGDREDVTSPCPSSLRSSEQSDSTPTGGLGEGTCQPAAPDPRGLPLSRRRKISGMTDDELEASLAGCHKVLGAGLSGAVTAMVKAAAERNKGGSMAYTKAYREFFEPLARTVHQLDRRHGQGRKAVEHGVVVAMQGGKVESSRYAQAVAEKWVPGEDVRVLPGSDQQFDAVAAMYGGNE